MKTIISEKGEHLGGFLRCVVVGKFCKRQQFEPVVLLVIAEYAGVGFEGLIHSFGLTIGLRMESSGFSRIDLED